MSVKVKETHVTGAMETDALTNRGDVPCVDH